MSFLYNSSCIKILQTQTGVPTFSKFGLPNYVSVRAALTAADGNKQLRISNAPLLFTSWGLTADKIVKGRLIRQLERATVCEAAAVTRRPLITDLLRWLPAPLISGPLSRQQHQEALKQQAPPQLRMH